jgi:hypothetical protein
MSAPQTPHKIGTSRARATTWEASCDYFLSLAAAICVLENESTVDVKKIAKHPACTAIVSFSSGLAARKYFDVKLRCASC